jgi:hypothetical protein
MKAVRKEASGTKCKQKGVYMGKPEFGSVTLNLSLFKILEHSTMP